MPKKEKPTALVLLVIWLLLLVIILPPVLRVVMPKATKNTSTTTKEITKILTCTKINNTELYNITSTCRYLNNKINTNTIVYTKMTAPDTTATSTTGTISVASEFDLFDAAIGINAVMNGANMTFIINQDLITKNSTNTDLLKYFQSYAKQKTYYESEGYTCS